MSFLIAMIVLERFNVVAVPILLKISALPAIFCIFAKIDLERLVYG